MKCRTIAVICFLSAIALSLVSMEANAWDDVCWTPHEDYFDERKEELDFEYSWLNVNSVRTVYFIGKPAYALVMQSDDLAFDVVTSLGSSLAAVVTTIALDLGTDAALEFLRTALEDPRELAAEIGGRTMERGLSGLNDNYRVYTRGISGLSDAAKLEFRQRQVYVDLMGPAKELYKTARDDESATSAGPAVLDNMSALESVLDSMKGLGLLAATMEVAEALQQAGTGLETYPPYAEYQQAVAAVHDANGIIPCRPTESQHTTAPAVSDDKDAEGKIDEARTVVSSDKLPSHCREWNTSFLEIIQTGRPEDIIACIHAGADVNVREEWFGNTPLHEAAYRENRAAFIAALLEAGADHQIENNFGHTPLITALSLGPDEENILALKWTASPPQCQGTGVDRSKLFRDLTPMEVVLCADAARGANAGGEHWTHTLLHWAALSHGDPAVIDALVENGADPNAQDGRKHTPLHFASMANDNPAVVRALLANGAEPDMLRNDDRTPLYLAASYNQAPEVIDALVEAGADANTLVYSRQSPLHWAAKRNRNPAVVSALLKAGVDPNVRDSTERTPLHWAVEYNSNPSVISVLLKAGAYPNAHDWKGTTPLDIAIAKGRSREIIASLEAAIKHVLECSISAWLDGDVFRTAGPGDIFFCANELEHVDLTNTLDSNVYTILHMAARDNENPEVIAELIDHGLDVSSLNDFDETPLHLAAIHNRNPAVIRELINAGADPNLRARRFTPLLLAFENGRDPSILKILLEAGADPNIPESYNGETALHRAIRENASDIITLLLNAGARADLPDNNGYTAMHLAARSERLTAITAMLENGADPNARDKSEGTPLHDAATDNKDGAIVKALLDAGADVNARDWLEKTPLHWAAKYNRSPEVIATLIQAGADSDAEDNEGKTPLQIAKDESRPAEIIAALAGDEVPAGDAGLSGDSMH